MRRGKGFIPAVLVILPFAAVSVASVSASDNDIVVTTESVGSGLDFKAPRGIAVTADGFLVVLDPGSRAVMRVDPATGNRIIVSNASIGSGLDFKDPMGIAVEADGSLVVIDHYLEVVMRVDPTTGDRTIVSGDYVP